MAEDMNERARLLGALGGDIISIFPRLQKEVTEPHEDLVQITRSESELLRVVLLDPGSTVSQIAEAIAQHRSNTSTRIASLVAKGLLEKRAVEGDGREVRVFPTRRASVNLAGFQRIWADILSEVTTATTEEIEVAARVLDEIASRIALWRAGVDADGTGA
ncbi:hypothetical protein CZ771_02665 [Actinomycetales bacterium JB111]|nr:hypothetical protein CZ771_02665 [Actinomycetales bacterium JB111]